MLQSLIMAYIKYLFTFPTNLLLVILLLSFLIRVVNLNYNSPFLDEAIYLTLGKQVLSWQWQSEDPYAWVGGNPLFYPTLSAIFGFFGGIVGARFFSVLLGTFSVYLMYQFGKILKLSKEEKTNQLIGLISSAFLGVLAMPVFLSRWAIYDMLSFTLFLLGVVLLQRALNLKNPKLWQPEGRFFAAAAILFMSFLAKYITLILFPAIIIWALYKSKQVSKETFSVALRYFALPLLLGTGFYFFRYMEDLIHFQTEQVSTISYSVDQILMQYIMYSFPAIAIALGGAVMLLRRNFITTIFLLGAASIVPVVHAVTSNFASVHQHAYLSILFLLPLGAYFFTRIYEKVKVLGNLVVVIVLLTVLTYSQTQVRALESMWTNTNDVLSYLEEKTTSHERIYAPEADVAAVDLSNIKNENIVGQYSFKYKNIENNNAYSTAIKESYFDFIVIDNENTSEVSKTVKNSLTNHYSPVYNNHPFTVYKKGT